jgi:hypothetical protein
LKAGVFLRRIAVGAVGTVCGGDTILDGSSVAPVGRRIVVQPAVDEKSGLNLEHEAKFIQAVWRWSSILRFL